MKQHALAYWLCGNYVLVGVWYAVQKDWPRVLYWFGALCIVGATTVMK